MAKITERQYPLVAIARVSIESAATTTIQLPPNAMLMGGYYHVYEAATGTTPTLTMVDSAETPDTILSAVAIGTAPAGGVLDEAAALGNFYPSGTTLSFTTGGTDTPAGGDVLVAVQFVVVGRSNEVYGSDN